MKACEKDEVVWERVDNPNQTKSKEAAPIQLPSSLFASTSKEEPVGLLNLAATTKGPRPDWDPDIVAALDDDYDFENPDNQLDDNFMEIANGGADAIDEDDEYYDDEEEEEMEEEGDYESDFSGNASDEERDIVKELRHAKMETFDEEETKTRFTNYSMSSSVNRNEQLTLLDNRFEEMYKMYDEPEIGSLECEDIEGEVKMNNDMIFALVDDFQREQQERHTEYNKKWDEARIKQLMERESSDEELVELEVEDVNDQAKKKWDCESILSTYSNIYNHPKMIEVASRKRASDRIELNPKTGMPVGVLKGDNSNTLTASTLARLNVPTGAPGAPKSLCAQSVMSTLSVLSIRPKDELPEERRERKKLLKEYRTERRLERKANREAFKEEGKRQVKIKLNQNNNRGTTIV